MKFEADTEIDRLLRRYARRAAVSASSAPQAASDDGSAATLHAGDAHLDADELNAYAEGALPESARAHYMTHLADCAECRGLVTKLTLAASVAAESSAHATPVATSSAPRSWRSWLAAFFAPPVLRYAVPALVLLAVVAVAFIATRERRPSPLVAQNEQRPAQPTTERTQTEEQKAATATANSSASPALDGPQNTDSTAAASNQRQADASVPPGQERQREAVADTPEMPAAQNEPKPAPPPPVNDGSFGKQPDTESAKAGRAQPPPAAPAPAVKSPAEDNRLGEEQNTQKRSDTDEKNKNAGPQSSVASASSSSGVGILDRAENRAQGNARSVPESERRENPARKSRPASPQLSRDATGSDDKDESVTETRSAGGRQFRRKGGVWVDTAYNSSRGVVNVARGSEQYRALVADEPGIASIADQLGGTVIIVWKSRAYKIY